MTQRLRHLRPALATCAILLAGAVGITWIVVGPAGAVGVGLGVGIVAASYTASTLAIAWADSINPRLVFGVGMGMYVTKFSLLGMMMIAVGGTEWSGRVPMAVGIVLAVIVWTGTQIWWTVNNAHPYVNPG